MEKNFSSLEDCKVACKMTEGSRTKQWIHFFSKVFGENEKCVFYFYVRAETRYWRDQQTEEAITEGNALEATGHRLKPCGYYGLHRILRNMSDQGTSQKWAEPTILTTKPEKDLDIFLLFLWSIFLSFFSFF